MLFEGIENIEVVVLEGWSMYISEEEKKAAEFEDTLNTNY